MTSTLVPRVKHWTNCLLSPIQVSLWTCRGSDFFFAHSRGPDHHPDISTSMNVPQINGGAACGDVFHQQRKVFQFTIRLVIFLIAKIPCYHPSMCTAFCFCEIVPVVAQRNGHFFPCAYHFSVLFGCGFSRVFGVVHDPGVVEVQARLHSRSQQGAVILKLRRVHEQIVSELWWCFA